MRMWVCLFLFLITCSNRSATNQYTDFLQVDHAIYISVVEIKTMETSADIQIKVFKDDLYNSLQNFSAQEKIDEADFPVRYGHAISRYFEEHFFLEINQEPRIITYEGFDDVGDSYWLKFKVQSIPSAISSVVIEADYFMELFPGQQNIINLKMKDQDPFFCRLTQDKSICETAYSR